MNKIHQLDINFSLFDEHCDTLKGPQLGRWTQGQLLPILENVIEKINDEIPPLSQRDIVLAYIDVNIEVASLDELERTLFTQLYRQIKETVDYACLTMEDNSHAKASDEDATPKVNDAQSPSVELAGKVHRLLTSLFVGTPMYQGGALVDCATSDDVAGLWASLVASAPKLLDQNLRRYLIKSHYRKHAAESLSVSEQAQIIRVLEPANADFILSFIGHSAQLADRGEHGLVSPGLAGPDVEDGSDDEKKSHSARPVERLSSNHVALLSRPYLIEFTLAYMCCERGSRFNNRQYLRSVLRQIAEHNNIDVNELSTSLLFSLRSAVLPDKIKCELLDVLALGNIHCNDCRPQIPRDRLVENAISAAVAGEIEPPGAKEGGVKEDRTWQSTLSASDVDRMTLEHFTLDLDIQTSSTRESDWKRLDVQPMTEGDSPSSARDELKERRAYNYLQQVLSTLNFNCFSDPRLYAAMEILVSASPSRLASLFWHCQCASKAVAVLVHALPQHMLMKLSRSLNTPILLALSSYESSLKSMLAASSLFRHSHLVHACYWQCLLLYILQRGKAYTSSRVLGEFLWYFVRTLSRDFSLHPVSVSQALLESMVGQKGKAELPQGLNAPQNWDICAHLYSIIMEHDRAREPSKDGGPQLLDTIESRSQELSEIAINAAQIEPKRQAILRGHNEEDLVAIFVYSLRCNEWVLSPAQWQLLLNTASNGLRRVVSALLGDAQLRQQVALELPWPISRDFIELVDAQSLATVTSVCANAEAMTTLVYLDSRQFKSAVTKKIGEQEALSLTSNMQAALREFTFHYLFVDRGSEFNRRSYARSLLRQLAVRHNLAYGHLLTNLQYFVCNPELPAQLRQLFVSVIDEQSPLPSPTSSISRAEEGAHYLDEFVSLLTNSARATDRQVIALLHRLQAHHVDFLVRLVKLLQVYPIPVQRLQRVLSADALIVLLAKVVFVLNGGNTQQQSLMEDTILHCAEKSGKKAIYLCMSIDTLLKGEPIDVPKLNATVSQWSNVSYDRADHKEVKGTENIIAFPNQVWGNVHTSNMGEDTPARDRKHAFNKVYKIEKSQRYALKFAKLAEVQLIRLFSAVDDAKFSRLLPSGQLLCNSLMALQAEFLANKSTCDLRFLTMERFNFLMCKSLAAQFVHVKQLASMDRFVQCYIAQLLRLSGSMGSDLCFHQLRSNLLRVLHQNFAVHKAWIQGVRKSLESLTDSDVLPPSIGSQEVKPAAKDLELLKAYELRGKQLLKNITSTRLKNQQSHDLPLELDVSQEILAINAGLVIISPYMPTLFERCGVLVNKTIDEIHGKNKGIQLLYFMACGHDLFDNYHPNDLVFLKILLGHERHEPCEFSSALSQEDIECCESLLSAVIAHWRALGSTSIEGLRETFLQRSGTLQYDEEKGWSLAIHKHTLDVLLSRLPWGFSAIKHPFMNDPIHVTWQ